MWEHANVPGPRAGSKMERKRRRGRRDEKDGDERASALARNQPENTTERAKKDQKPPGPNPKKKKDTRNQPQRITQPSHADDAPSAP